MLISAGMGIGLMFWSVGEPIFHFMTPSPMFNVPPSSAQSAQVALGLTYYHCGVSIPGASMPWWDFPWPFLPIIAAFP
jgi:choline-glycine betaine transporter